MPFLDHLEELRWRLLTDPHRGRGGDGARVDRGRAHRRHRSADAADRSPSPRGKAQLHQSHRSILYHAEVRVHCRAGGDLALRPVPGVGVSGAGAVRAGTAHRRPGARERDVSLHRGRGGRVLPGAAARSGGAARIPESGAAADHHGRPLFRIRGTDHSRFWGGHGAAARHHHPHLARPRDPGRLAAQPPLRPAGRGGARGVSHAARRPVDVDDDGAAAACCTK